VKWTSVSPFCPAGVIQTILANSPLRSLTMRASIQLSFSNLELASDTLETFVIMGSKLAYVSTYRCPKLKNLLFDRLYCGDNERTGAVLKPLQDGVHSIDVTTMPAPADRARDWFRVNFRDGVFVKDR